MAMTNKHLYSFISKGSLCLDSIAIKLSFDVCCNVCIKTTGETEPSNNFLITFPLGAIAILLSLSLSKSFGKPPVSNIFNSLQNLHQEENCISWWSSKLSFVKKGVNCRCWAWKKTPAVSIFVFSSFDNLGLWSLSTSLWKIWWVF